MLCLLEILFYFAFFTPRHTSRVRCGALHKRTSMTEKIFFAFRTQDTVEILSTCKTINLGFDEVSSRNRLK